jgi:hypothetical protein
MIQYGGTALGGVKVTACLTTFQDLLAGTHSSQATNELWATSATLSSFAVDGKFCLVRFAPTLDRLCSKQQWRKLALTYVVDVGKALISICTSYTILQYTGSDGRVVELMIYHAALFCRNLPRKSRSEVADWLMQQLTDRLSIITWLISMSEDHRRLKSFWSKHSRAISVLIVEFSFVMLQLAEILNADDDVIQSDDLKVVREFLGILRDAGILLRYPTFMSSRPTQL